MAQAIVKKRLTEKASSAGDKKSLAERSSAIFTNSSPKLTRFAQTFRISGDGRAALGKNHPFRISGDGRTAFDQSLLSPIHRLTLSRFSNLNYFRIKIQTCSATKRHLFISFCNL
jgi:hypothetical protein